MFEGPPENKVEWRRRLEESGKLIRFPAGSLFRISEHPELVERLRSHRASKEFHQALVSAAMAGEARVSVEDAIAAPIDLDTHLERPTLIQRGPDPEYWDDLGN